MTVPKPFIRTADGRTFYGSWPQSLPRNGEREHVISLASHVRGVCEVNLPVGRVDVATDTTVYEVEPVGAWRAGARQAFSYAGMSGLAPALALFGPADYQKIYVEIRDKMRPLELWVWAGRWERVTSVRTATRVTPIQVKRPAPKHAAPPPAPAAWVRRVSLVKPPARAIDDPARLAEAARIVRLALARQRLTIEDLASTEEDPP